MSAPWTEVLITGFGPFPGVARNVSGWLVQTLARDYAVARCGGLAAAVLPVSWRDAWGVLEPLLDHRRPRQIIMFGVSAQASGFCLEQRSYNVVSAMADADGERPGDERLCQDGPEMLDSTLPVCEIAAALSASGLQAEISHDPGRYLCNALSYQTLHWARADPDMRAGFVHIPQEAPEMAGDVRLLDSTRLLTGARLIVETAIRRSRTAQATA